MVNFLFRARFIHQHLRPDLQARLTEHLARIIGKAPTHRLRDEESEQRVASVYKPHKKLIQRLVKKSRARKFKKPFDLKTQRGGALFSILLGGLIPLLAGLVILNLYAIHR